MKIKTTFLLFNILIACACTIGNALLLLSFLFMSYGDINKSHFYVKVLENDKVHAVFHSHKHKFVQDYYEYPNDKALLHTTAITQEDIYSEAIIEQN